MRRALAIVVASLFASPLNALDLTPVGGIETARVEANSESIQLPRQPWQAGQTIDEVEGLVRRAAFRIPSMSITTLQLIEPARETLEDAGYSPVFSCADSVCGGFDFRFKLDLLPAPDMFVDLGNYRYLLAEKPGAEPHTVALLASSSASAGFLHITEVFRSIPVRLDVPAADGADPKPPTQTSDLIGTLVEQGHAVLSDLDFATGSSDLGPGPFRSLQLLADWLQETPSARVVLVGHTDSVGSLEANKALSRRRANSVLDRLIGSLGVSASQINADGAGALSPIASNLEPEGRAANRRVEIVLLSLE